MNVEQFFHVCRSAAAISGVREVTAFGAAAVVPWIARDCPGAPFWPSMELDVDPGGESKADLVDGTIGELSLFEDTFGVRAHGVTLEAFISPRDWTSRAGAFDDPTSGVRVRVPHPVDLVVAKLVRGEQREYEFAAYCMRHLSVSAEGIEQGLAAIERERADYVEPVRLARSLLAKRLPPR